MSFISPGRRLMDVAYIRDKKLLHTGEALLIACLLKVNSKKTSKRDIAKIMKDPNETS